jgi:hypothetical protein
LSERISAWWTGGSIIARRDLVDDEQRDERQPPQLGVERVVALGVREAGDPLVAVANATRWPPLVRGAVALEQADVMEHRPYVDELGVVLDAHLLCLQRRPQEHAS